MSRSLISRIAGSLRQRTDPLAPLIDVPGPGAWDRSLGDPPIFVIGCFRSGTSLLRRILDSHSRIACPPESKFIAPLAEVFRRRNSLKGLATMGYGKRLVAALPPMRRLDSLADFDAALLSLQAAQAEA